MERQLASRYAEALFSAAWEKKETDRIESDLKVVAQLLADVPDLGRILDHPEVALERKITLLERAFSEAVTKTTYAFLKLLVRRGRSHLISLVEDEYERLADQARGIAKVQVWTAVPMTDEQQVHLQQALQRVTGKTAELEIQIDSTILAGVRLQIGDQLVDGSAAGRLEALRASLREIGTVE